jgi:hypothetical protein
VENRIADKDEINLLYKVGCLVAGGKRSEHEVLVCASSSLLHQRAVGVPCETICYGAIRATRSSLRMSAQGWRLCHVGCLGSALETLSEGRRIPRRSSGEASVQPYKS